MAAARDERPDEILVVGEADRHRAAVLSRGRLVDVMTVPREDAGGIGSLYLGRIVRRIAAMNAAFVEIGLSQPAFLNLAKGTPAEGKPAIVQLVEAPSAGKAARVSTRIAVEGRFLVLLPREKGIAPSRRLGKPDAARLAELIRPLLQPGEGVVLRANARAATAESLATELSTLRRLWQAASARAEGSPPRRLHAEPGLRRILCAFDSGKTRFIFGDTGSARLARAAATTIDPAIADRIEATDEGAALFERGDVAGALAGADEPVVPLPSGGRIAVEATAALVAVDVDSGTGNPDPLATNCEAAAEVARQLRLRELGGTVLIDFIRMPAKGGRDKVERRLAEAVAIDRMAVQLLGWTRGGLFELVRARNLVG
jgi:Rne/Rng family ribonuclease